MALPQVLSELTSLLSSFTFPLFADDDRGRPQQIGSSFVVRSGNEHYLVSAAHDLGRVCPIVGVGTKFRKGVGIIGTDVGIAIGMIKRLSQEAL